MKNKIRVKKILNFLNSTYPDVETQLSHKTPFQLLVSTILSAQCTDRQVNSVTPGLFKKYSLPTQLASAEIKEIERIIYSTGFYRNKAKNLKNCCRMLVEKYNGNVPETLAELVELPGVGRKTANVVLGASFNIPAMVVDTHVARISKRLDLTKHTDPVKIESDLEQIIPKEEWNNFSLRLIYFGRAICTARKPDCPGCPLNGLCRQVKPKLKT
ncbi:MAG: endonuclease III [Deltaproteobacteria bacterium]|nr:endonuclease III [Deltaproteobacteria bacterium]MBW2220829.1 endonuclease III [Deltaproteobacteria bacterium]